MQQILVYLIGLLHSCTHSARNVIGDNRVLLGQFTFDQVD